MWGTSKQKEPKAVPTPIISKSVTEKTIFAFKSDCWESSYRLKNSIRTCNGNHNGKIEEPEQQGQGLTGDRDGKAG
ncbi:hypothetical protein FEM48_Zijuj10G0110900 [Ziziphus jujuba var. spinosa]|uniref:Uncharacterized protein n=1 Tax=Ziziphus jujuba var. spinosa TaxID=714518 RepID=A0A978UN06_ZIZJJ|nr:hypothetical protein FEM48_Zijuj10G0110900 [Ziziphus jujuba var. spinosa]